MVRERIACGSGPLLSQGTVHPKLESCAWAASNYATIQEGLPFPISAFSAFVPKWPAATRLLHSDWIPRGGGGNRGIGAIV